ncbi:hypothetical protein QVD17_04018 [Tagetes erecta]|uniref:BED-type domain-containing protein n=1 Tax=Tagetes erecta TaxID=13708 RepID=A0AAD8PAE8_TARER|nr:hypothetical protein QVD17_04018 [Tagetes erecta]
MKTKDATSQLSPTQVKGALATSNGNNEMEPSGSETRSVSKNDAPVIDVDEENLKEANNVVDEETVEKDDIECGNKRSYVWDHFTLDKNKEKAKCSFCKKWIGVDSKKHGTSGMSSHLKSACKTSPYYKKVDKSKQSTLNFKKGLGEGTATLVAHKFNQETCRHLLAVMCMKDNRPFSVVDDEGFREFVWGLNPSFKFPSRWTVARDCMKIYREYKNDREEEKKSYMNFLKLFFDVTKKISGSRYATSNVVFIELSKLHSSITTMSLSDVQKEKDMAVSMKQKLAKYWDNIDNINLLLYVALILDPRNKMSYLGYSLSLVYGSDATEKIKAVAALAKGALKELYNAYKSKIDKTQESHSTSVSTSNGDLEEDWLRSSPSDLQDSDMLGQQLQDIIENLENIEDDMLSGSKTRKDSTVGGDENWE